ncbi:MAG: NAD-dependent epimerase/dehydratase family protein [Cytophagales bacterium]|nr:NAD-dependent epimerase/dehydratase family protein [Cytophagales bacterium]
MIDSVQNLDQGGQGGVGDSDSSKPWDAVLGNSKKTDIIVVTGARGFLGFALSHALRKKGYKNLVLVDDMSKSSSLPIPEGAKEIERSSFFAWVEKQKGNLDFVFHMGAKTNPLERSFKDLYDWNFMFSRRLFEICVRESVPLVYASTGATYGKGEHGFSDSEYSGLKNLDPLTPYATYKHEFDQWVVAQPEKPFFWACVKLFSVYGPGEENKNQTGTSVIYKMYRDIQEKAEVEIFQSPDPKYENGSQSRDFIYVDDVLNVLIHLMENRKTSGISNVGSGESHSFKEIARLLFQVMGKEEKIRFVDMPKHVARSYQYYVKADIRKLREEFGYPRPMHSLEEGISKYLNYLSNL